MTKSQQRIDIICERSTKFLSTVSQVPAIRAARLDPIEALRAE